MEISPSRSFNTTGRVDAEILTLYAITNRRLYGTDEARARQRLLDLTKIWASDGVAFIQLREKDLPARDQVELARAMLQIIRAVPNRGAPCPDSRTWDCRLLVNGRADIALAAGADGVHLPSGSDALTPEEVRGIFTAARAPIPTISVSCHTIQEVEAARHQKPDCILFAPVFEKRIGPQANPLPGSGLDLLRQACQQAAPVPVLALGGITAQNASQCLQAGAAGIAAIRLLQQPPSTWRHLA